MDDEPQTWSQFVDVLPDGGFSATVECEHVELIEVTSWSDLIAHRGRWVCPKCRVIIPVAIEQAAKFFRLRRERGLSA